jgi:hypothetical protein
VEVHRKSASLPEISTQVKKIFAHRSFAFPPRVKRSRTARIRGRRTGDRENLSPGFRAEDILRSITSPSVRGRWYDQPQEKSLSWCQGCYTAASYSWGGSERVDIVSVLETATPEFIGFGDV